MKPNLRALPQTAILAPTGSGGGPDDPMLNERVENLEKRIERVEGKLSSIELLLSEIKGQLSQMPKAADLTAVRSDIATVRADVARIEGKIGNLPSFWQVANMVFATGLTLFWRGGVK